MPVKSYIPGSLGISALGSDYFRLGPCNVYYGKLDPAALTGTVTRDTVNLKELDGTGTQFTSELKVGDYIVFDLSYAGIPWRIVSIIDNGTLLVDRDLPNISASNFYKVDLINLGFTDATSLKWKVNKVDLKASQMGDSPADRATTGYEVSVEMGLTNPTLERLDRIVQGFIAQFDVNANYKGAAFVLPIGQFDSEIANELHLIRIVNGAESIDPLDHIRIFKAVPVTDTEVKYDASSQLILKQTFNAYADYTKKINGAPAIFAVGDVTFT